MLQAIDAFGRGANSRGAFGWLPLGLSVMRQGLEERLEGGSKVGSDGNGQRRYKVTCATNEVCIPLRLLGIGWCIRIVVLLADGTTFKDVKAQFADVLKVCALQLAR